MPPGGVAGPGCVTGWAAGRRRRVRRAGRPGGSRVCRAPTRRRGTSGRAAAGPGSGGSCSSCSRAELDHLVAAARAPSPRAPSLHVLPATRCRRRTSQEITSTGRHDPGHLQEGRSYTPQGGTAEQVDPVHDPAADVRARQPLPAAAEQRRARERQPARPGPAGVGAAAARLRPDAAARRLLVLVQPAGGRRLAARAASSARSAAPGRRSTARRRGPRTTFADVAGIDEVKDEVTEIVDFLRDPDKYRRLGAQIPRGRAALGPARQRQDAARPGRRR